MRRTTGPWDWGVEVGVVPRARVADRPSGGAALRDRRGWRPGGVGGRMALPGAEVGVRAERSTEKEERDGPDR